MSKALDIRLFGPIQASRDGRGIVLGTRRERAVLAYLAVQGQAVSRQRLAVHLWPDADEPLALTRLRRLMHRMATALGGDVLDVTRQHVGLTDAASQATDVTRFRALLQLGLFRPERDLDAAAVAALEQAAMLSRGELAEGLIIDECEELAAWLDRQRESTQQTHRQILVRLATYYQHRTDYTRALNYAQALVAADPLHETSQRQLMQLYAVTGETAAAMRQFERCRAALHTELGVEPEPETLRLAAELRARNAARPEFEPPPPSEVRFARNCDVHLAYLTSGSGPVDVLVISGFVSHVEQAWEPCGPVEFFRSVAAMTRLIVLDRRGVGSSDRVVDAVDVGTSVGDVVAVLDAAKSRRTIVFAASEAGPIGIRLAVEHPERVAGLVLWGTLPVGTAAPGFPWALTSEQFGKWTDLLIGNWGKPTSLQAFAPAHVEDPALNRWWARMLRLGSSPGCMRAVLRTFAATDVRALLGKVRVPTVVLHRREDRAVRVEAGRYVAEHIPRARWVELPGSNHWWWLGDSKPILDEIAGLLRKST